MGWVFGHVERRHGASVDWTEEEVEVSHSTFLSLLQLSSSLTILPFTSSSISISTPLPVQPVTHYIRVANIAFQYHTTRTFQTRPTQ